MRVCFSSPHKHRERLFSFFLYFYLFCLFSQRACAFLGGYGLAVVVGERVIEASLVKDRRRTVSGSVNRAFNSLVTLQLQRLLYAYTYFYALIINRHRTNSTTVFYSYPCTANAAMPLSFSLQHSDASFNLLTPQSRTHSLSLSLIFLQSL